ncbi:MAG: Bifunctional transcriptional activator/DNA repair enzyme Ada [Phycisphaerales bacterium]|nr:Bifunctional transcriptional activator/DNA repair enzyme Ada [Phycisphaerales bacterium]
MKARQKDQAWSSDRMYDAFRRRDAALAGKFYMAVTSTGIFCRPGCPAKLPRPERCEFYPTPAAAMQAGYRPCLRCKPLQGPGEVPAWAAGLAALLAADPPRLVTADDARRLGVHPATAARYFRARMGSTFQALSRARRVGAAIASLRAGQVGLSRAVRQAGFESESGFRKAASELFGSRAMQDANDLRTLTARWLTTPLGPMVAVASDTGVCLLEFLDRRMLETNFRTLRGRLGCPIVPGASPFLDQVERELAEYFAGRRSVFDVPLHAPGTPFQELVWAELRRIPSGQTRSYQQIAAAIGRPSAVRAVARANGDNRIAILIPCHRVIGADGSLTGYGGGLDRKARLLEIEGVAGVSGLFEIAQFAAPD